MSVAGVVGTGSVATPVTPARVSHRFYAQT